MLKKSAIALAVAAAIAAPVVAQADVTVYGRVSEVLTFDKDEEASLENEGHRIGVKGSTKTDGGLDVSYKIELETGNGDDNAFGSKVATAFNTRLSYISLAGGFGSVTVGRQGNPFADIYKDDVFERDSGALEIVSFRHADAVVYKSNDMGGFNFFAGAVMDQNLDADGNEGDAIDGTNIGVNFKVAGIDVTVANSSRTEDGSNGAKFNNTGVGVSWTGGPLYLAGRFETESENEVSTSAFAATYDLGGITIGGGIETCSSDDVATDLDADDEIDQAVSCGVVGEDKETKSLVGVYAGLGGGVSTYAEFANYTEADVSHATVGLRVSF